MLRIPNIEQLRRIQLPSVEKFITRCETIWQGTDLKVSDRRLVIPLYGETEDIIKQGIALLRQHGYLGFEYEYDLTRSRSVADLARPYVDPKVIERFALPDEYSGTFTFKWSLD